jgi:hypothetical protein
MWFEMRGRERKIGTFADSLLLACPSSLRVNEKQALPRRGECGYG